MKKFLILLFAISAYYTACAQDVITLRNATQIKAEVLNVSPNKIEYRKNDADSLVHSIDTKEAFLIRYKDGKKLYIPKESSVQPEPEVKKTPGFFRWPVYSQSDLAFGYGIGLSRPGYQAVCRLYFDIVTGLRVNPYFFAGAGLGIYHAYDDRDSVSGVFPATLTVNVKGYYPVGDRTSLYLSADIGGMFGAGNFYPNEHINRFVYGIGPGIETWGINFGVLYHHMGSLGDAISIRIGILF